MLSQPSEAYIIMKSTVVAANVNAVGIKRIKTFFILKHIKNCTAINNEIRQISKISSEKRETSSIRAPFCILYVVYACENVLCTNSIS